MNDREIRNRLQSGDPLGLDALYSQSSPAIYGFALRLTGNVTHAEDLVQDVFIAAWLARGSFRGDSKLHSWLLGIAVRRWRDHCRRHHIPTSELTDEIYDGVCDERAAVETEVTNRIVVGDAVENLPLPLREALLLVVCQGLTYREVAQITGDLSGTLKWRVAEAIRRLRKELHSTYQKVEGNDYEETMLSRSEPICL